MLYKKFSLLCNINSKLSEALDLKKTLRPILPLIADHTEMLRGALTILKRSTGATLIEEGFGLLPGERAKARYRPGEGMISKILEGGNPAIIPRMFDEPLFLDMTSSQKIPDKRDIAFMGVPIKLGKEVIGALAVDRLFHEQISCKEDLQLLTIIASSIAQAVRLRALAEEEREKILQENHRLRDELRVNHGPENIIGDSKVMQNIYGYIDTVSRTNTTILILGESGVGKERIAKAIHYDSNRADEAFMKVSCAIMPESLIERELFGHEKGAVIGMTGLRRGNLEIADGGTLFFEDIGELTPVLQAKLLRVLKKREFERVGGNRAIKVDVRVIAAANQDLEARMREGKFSEDLYYQLNIFPIMVPPLRERNADIILLADHFIEKYAKELGKEVAGISSSALDLLMSYHWPGNVRELEGCIERAIILSTDRMIHHDHLPPSLRGNSISAQTEIRRQACTC